VKRKSIITCFLLSTLLVGGCLTLFRWPSTTVPEVERKIDQALPVGSTRQDVEAWLIGQGIKFNFSDTPKSHSSILNALPDIDRYPTAISGIIRDTDYSFPVSGSIELYFLFGPDERLQKRVVRWIGTGP
jgi:hypothetical protein